MLFILAMERSQLTEGGFGHEKSAFIIALCLPAARWVREKQSDGLAGINARQWRRY